jgi:hypothetical protein
MQPELSSTAAASNPDNVLLILMGNLLFYSVYTALDYVCKKSCHSDKEKRGCHGTAPKRERERDILKREFTL